MPDLIGTDLKVVPFLVAYDAAALDLALRERPLRRLPGALPAVDLDLHDGWENLAQALILRLLTPRGSLRDLGHAVYGSRLHELIGRPKTSALRNLCRAFVLEAVAQEPRVQNEAVDLVFDPDREGPDSFVFTLVVQPIQRGDPLRLSLEVAVA